MIRWELKHFNELTANELYAYLALRTEVFVVEQNCPYLDADGNDPDAWHLIAWEDKTPVACSRILAPGKIYSEASIGRVVSRLSHRRQKLGHEVMKRSIDFIRQQFPGQPIMIGAQAYLQKFYEEHGFVRVSDIYLEDDIPHIKMLCD